jgi:hypothetical protein
MEKAKRARKAETPKQPSLRLRLRAPYLYPDPTEGDPATVVVISSNGEGDRTVESLEVKVPEGWDVPV